MFMRCHKPPSIIIRKRSSNDDAVPINDRKVQVKISVTSKLSHGRRGLSVFCHKKLQKMDDDGDEVSMDDDWRLPLAFHALL